MLGLYLYKTMVPRCVGMKGRILASILLLTIALSIVGAATPYVASESVAKGIFVAVLPTSVPSDPKVGNVTVEFLATVNKLVYEGYAQFYLVLNDTKVGGISIPAGSILIVGKLAPELIELANESGGAIKIYKVPRTPFTMALELKPLKIAVLNYADYVKDTTLVSYGLPKLEFKFTLITNDTITDLLKGKYDVLILPPGSGTAIARHLGPGGAKIVARFLHEGGGMVGICAGAYAPIKGYNEPTSWFQLVDATLKNWPTWALGTGRIFVEIVDPKDPVVLGFSDTITMIYWNGPVLTYYDLGKNTVLGIDVPPPRVVAKYIGPDTTQGAFNPGSGLSLSQVANTMKDGFAIVDAVYGKGRIILFGPHPELTSGELETSKIPTIYNLRMLWNAIYYAAGYIVEFKPIVGTWMWPTTIRILYEELLKLRYGTTNVDKEKKIETLRDAMEYLARELKSYGVTDVFLLVKGTRGVLIWPSEVAKKYGTYTYCEGKYALEPYNLTDVLKMFVEVCHKYGIRVHAWIVVHYDKTSWGQWDPIWHCGKWFNATYFKPHYPVYGRVWLFNTTYQQYIADLAKELVEKEGVDGIHLDYIRWSWVGYSFGPKDYALAARLGINLSKVERYVIITYYGMPNESIKPQPDLIFKLYYEKKDPDVVKWYDLRRQAVINITKKVKEAVESTGRHVILSAAVFPEEATDYIELCRTDLVTHERICAKIPGQAWQWTHYGQHIEDFIKLGYWPIPMAYHVSFGKTPSWVGTVARYVVKMRNELNPEVKVLIGVQAWSVPYEDVLQSIGNATAAEADGYVFFRWGTFRSIAWSALVGPYEEDIDALKTLVPVIKAMGKILGKDVDDLVERIEVMGTVFKPKPGTYLSSYIADIVKDVKELVKDYASMVESRAQKLLGTPYYATYVDYLLSIVEENAKIVAEATKPSELIEPTKKMLDASIPILVSYASVEDMESKLSDLEYKLRLRIAEVGHGIKLVNDKMEVVKSEIEALKAALEDLRSALDDVVNKIATLPVLKSDVDTLKGKVSELEGLKSKVSSVESSIDSIKRDIASIKSSIDSLSKSVSDVSTSASNANSMASAAFIVAIVAAIVALLAIAVARKK